MRVAIDASNIRAGGGVTHLAALLNVADPIAHGFEQVIIWAPKATLELVGDRPWLTKRHDPTLEGHLLRRAFWQRYRLDKLIQAEGADVLFVPGGSFTARFRPVVIMSRNMLPFQLGELRRFGLSGATLKQIILRLLQTRSLRQANAVIFLTRFARDTVLKIIGRLEGATEIIPHGLDGRFFRKPRPQAPITDYTSAAPFRFVYVSGIAPYKHQWRVAEAVAQLEREGFPVRLDLYGPAIPSALRRLRRTLQRVDPHGRIIKYWGPVPHDEMPTCYAKADLCVFASSCEALPNVLLESMASGLPIACSDRGPMPEVLGPAGVYFNPEDAASVAEALRRLIETPALRVENAKSAFELAQAFSWTRCADQTFALLARVARRPL